ncbi:MAG: glucose-6-phosphate isomerase [Phycisphaerae bacterium]|nr:glucose-6-phosphate isomerase [Phycisphaerae bacterium]
MAQMRSLLTSFDLQTGLSPDRPSIQRRLSAMAGMFYNEARYAEMLAEEDSLIYEFYDMGVPAQAGEIAFGTSITYPGRVGDEYFMTKGHFHTILETGEVYYCLRGQGMMLMENPEGRWEAQSLTAGAAVYVPPRYAHRSINVSPTDPLVTFFAFRGDAGHDYGTIETKGFRKLVVDKAGRPDIIDNPRWKEA